MMSQITVDFDAARWIDVPDTATDIAAEAAEAVERLFDARGRTDRIGAEQLTRSVVEDYAYLATAPGFGYLLFCGEPAEPLEIIQLVVHPTEPERQDWLRELAGDGGTEGLLSATSHPDLGEGQRLIRIVPPADTEDSDGADSHDEVAPEAGGEWGDAQALVLSITYLWQTQGLDIVLSVETFDLERGFAMVTHLDELAAGIGLDGPASPADRPMEVDR